MKNSLIITSQNRTKHLINLLEGVSRNTLIPDEIIIVSNDFEYETIGDYRHLNIKIQNFTENVFHNGRNRNLGASKAVGEVLFFLDVDCIPNKYYFERLILCINNTNALVMGEPKYLSKSFNKSFTFDELNDDSIYNPYRIKHDSCNKIHDYAIFWSLCFGLPKLIWEQIGGFDEDYIGYGAEDTDFGFIAETKNIDFFITDAIVFHQQHPICRPPVNHLKDIVYNSNLFYKKWNKWPMGGWLKDFVDLGLISWDSEQTEPIEIIKTLSDAEVQKYELPHARFV